MCLADGVGPLEQLRGGLDQHGDGSGGSRGHAAQQHGVESPEASSDGYLIGHGGEAEFGAGELDPCLAGGCDGPILSLSGTLLDKASGKDEYMSKYMSTDSFDGAACLRRLSAELFGAGVQNGRQRSSQSIEEAAWRVGMDPDQARDRSRRADGHAGRDVSGGPGRADERGRSCDPGDFCQLLAA